MQTQNFINLKENVFFYYDFINSTVVYTIRLFLLSTATKRLEIQTRDKNLNESQSYLNQFCALFCWSSSWSDNRIHLYRTYPFFLKAKSLKRTIKI